MPKGGNGGGGNTGGNTIRGSKRDDVINGTAGADVILAKEGNDLVDAGAGDDSVEGAAGHDTLLGGDGADTLLGGQGDDSLLGGADNDQLNAGQGNDALDGGAGDDTLVSDMLGQDALAGGSGTDTAVLSGASSDYTVTWLGGTAAEISDGAGNVTTVTDIENFEFSDGVFDFNTLANVPTFNLEMASFSAGTGVVEQGAVLSVGAFISADLDPIAAGTQVQTTFYLASAADFGSVLLSQSNTTSNTTDSSSIDPGATFAIPQDLAPGTYYVAAVVDPGDNFVEYDETDNASGWVEITVDPYTPPDVDFAAQAISAEPTWNGDPYDLGDTNGSFDVTVTVASEGTHTGVNGASYQVVLSTDAVFDASDLVLVSDAIGVTPGNSGSESWTINYADIPAGGDYYLGLVVADSFFDYSTYQTVDDVDPADNVMFVPISFVAAPIYGTYGNDLLTGTAGDDEIIALHGNDTLVAGQGYDTVDGGAGIDVLDLSGLTVDASNFGAQIIEDAPGLWQLVQPGLTDGYQLDATGFEEIIGTAGDDEVLLNTSTATIYAGAGNDWIQGWEGAINAEGGTGNDALLGIQTSVTGGAPADTLNGGDGDDVIFGGAGDDNLTGGAGVDQFFFEGSYELGADTVNDFDPFMDEIYIVFETGAALPLLQDVATQTAEGVVLSTGPSGTALLLGVQLADLDDTNVLIVEDGLVPAL